MAIEHLPFLTLQNAAFGPGRAKSSVLQGRGTTLSQNHPKIRGFQKFQLSLLQVEVTKYEELEEVQGPDTTSVLSAAAAAAADVSVV